jgi:hypothetical protein
MYCDRDKNSHCIPVQRMGTFACFINMSHGCMDSKVIICRLDVQGLISGRGTDISLWHYVETGCGDHAASCLQEHLSLELRLMPGAVTLCPVSPHGVVLRHSGNFPFSVYTNMLSGHAVV